MKIFFHRLLRIGLVIVLLALTGLVRAPIEAHLRARLIETNLLLPPPASGAIEQMSQSVLMGTLGGLRSLVATYLVLEAYDDFSVKDWDKLKQTYQIITSLEPREESHWTTVIWHIGINATANMEYDESLPAFERQRRFQEYAFEAIAIGERGLEQLPQSAAIRIQLAEVYREKLKDYCNASRLYGDAIGLPGAPGYVRRFHGYFMAHCPGKEREAYEYLLALYREGPANHVPTLFKEIQTLEKTLNIPLAERIPEADPDAPKPRTKPSSSNVLPGGIVVP